MHKKLTVVIPCILAACLTLTACSSKQMFMSGQDLKCQQQHDQDPYNQRDCKKEDFEEYQKQREQTLADAKKPS